MPRRSRAPARPRIELVGATARRDPLPVVAVLAGLLLVGACVAAYLLLRDRSGGRPAPAYRSTLGARLVRFDLASRLTGRTLHEVAVVPGGRAPRGRRPLLVLLHGKGMAPGFFLSDGLFSGLRSAGRDAPAVVALDGGTGSYWHDRRDGRWGSMVLREAIPAAARRLGADPRRVAIAGISMGGFGALDLARRRPHRFCAVGARSPAIFRAPGATAPGAFDDARDFRRHDLIAWARGARGGFGTTAVWIDRGDADPFRAGVDALAARLRGAQVHDWRGGHDAAYWHAHDRAFTAWAAAQLRRCRR